MFGIAVYCLVLLYIVWYCRILFGIVIYCLVLLHPVCLSIYRWQLQKEELLVLGMRQAAVMLGMLPLRANVALAW